MRQFVRVLRKEVTEVYFRPLVLFCLFFFSCTVVWISGQLNVERPPIRIFLYSTGVEEDVLNRAQDALDQFPDVKVIVRDGMLDQSEMRQMGASLAIVREGDRWLVLHGLTSLRQEEENSLVMNLIASSIQNGRPWLVDAAKANSSSLGEVSRLSALPRHPELALIPRTIALIVVFLPFVIAAQSYGRETMFGTLPILILSQGGGWAAFISAKVIVSVWVTIAILLFILLTIQPIFGISPKPGLLAELGAQGLASATSASIGLTAAVATRSQPQLFVSGAFYFLTLVLVSGFLFPLDTAAPIIRLVSNLSPLTFSGRIIEDWLFFGTPAEVFWRDLLFLGAQVAGSAILLSAAVFLARRRI